MSRRQGFTLLEVLLVLAVLVAIAALVLPAFRGPLENQRLQKSADLIRAECARTRVKAMRTGRIQVFRYQVTGGMAATAYQSGSQYRIEPWYAGDEMLEGDLDSLIKADSPLAVQAAMADVKVASLPDNVQFIASDTALDARSLEIDEAAQRIATTGEFWSRPILFYPDGTTSTSRMILGNRRERFVVIDLHGFTGIAKVSPLLTRNELPQ